MPENLQSARPTTNVMSAMCTTPHMQGAHCFKRLCMLGVLQQGLAIF